MQMQPKNKLLNYPDAQPVSPSCLLPEALPLIRADMALFLDFDGTLVELAAHPQAVLIPARLGPTLAALYRHLGGALALVSGRRLLDLDGFLAPLQLPSAAEHGAQRRDARQQPICAQSSKRRKRWLRNTPHWCWKKKKWRSACITARRPSWRLCACK